MLREVTQRPSRPASGEVLTEKIIEIVGSSMCSGGSGAGFSADVTVSPIEIAGKPARATISPQGAASIATRSSPSKANSCVTRLVTSVPSRRATATVSPTAILPENMRPMARRPR